MEPYRARLEEPFDNEGHMTIVGLADYIIEYYNQQGWEINNLRLCQVIYIVYASYYGRRHEPLFNDVKFARWSFSPVVEDVYFRYCLYGGYPVIKSLTPGIQLDDSMPKFFIPQLLKKIHSKAPWDIVALGCGYAWGEANRAGNKHLRDKDIALETTYNPKYKEFHLC